MKSSIDEVALQGIEFWSTVCDEEVDLAIEAAEVKVFLLADVFACTGHIRSFHCDRQFFFVLLDAVQNV
jgi:hypothetical protein